MRELLFLTSNKHKVLEVSPIAREYGISLIPVENLKIEVQSEDLEEIARNSALIGYAILGKPVLVEDAGLFIEALNGFPGPYSSYVYKKLGVSGIIKLMEGVSDRRACFRSVAYIVDGDIIAKGVGEVCGFITESPRGSRGFGFDPIFTPGEIAGWRTFAEMDIDEKNIYSHRAKAVREAFQKYLYAERHLGERRAQV